MMKRSMFLICSAVCLASSALSAKNTSPVKFDAFTGKVIGNKVRLRLSPSLEGHIIREIHKGEMFAVVNEDQEYYAVAPKQDLKAYIFKTHVLDGAVEGERVNIRLSPSLEAPIIGQLSSGQKVTINPKSSKGKWYQIDIPQTVHLWVAKDYVEKVGPVEYIAKYQERSSEAAQLLATANLISQAEFRKPFKEIDLSRLTKNYERVLSNYADLDDVHAEAKNAIQVLQKEYCDRKIAFLENKAGKAALEVKSLSAKLSDKTSAADFTSTQMQKKVSPFSSILEQKDLTDKMKIWQPLEYAEFQTWVYNNNKSDASLQDFYEEEFLNSKVVEGIVEPFSKIVKGKPGDYVMTKDGQTVAYLYSTHVNLNDFVGKEVNLKVTERDNHNFAFPAYYVLDLKKL